MCSTFMPWKEWSPPYSNNAVSACWFPESHCHCVQKHNSHLRGGMSLLWRQKWVNTDLDFLKFHFLRWQWSLYSHTTGKATREDTFQAHWWKYQTGSYSKGAAKVRRGGGGFATGVRCYLMMLLAFGFVGTVCFILRGKLVFWVPWWSYRWETEKSNK